MRGTLPPSIVPACSVTSIFRAQLPSSEILGHSVADGDHGLVHTVVAFSLLQIRNRMRILSLALCTPFWTRLC